MLRNLLILIIAFSLQTEAQPPLRKLLAPVVAAACPTNATAITYVNAYIAGGGSMTTPQKCAVDDFFNGMSALGYAASDIGFAYNLSGSTSSADLKYNMVDPDDDDASFRLSFVNGGTFSGTGYKRNGTSQYANTHFPANTLTSTDAGIILYVNEDVMEHGYDFYPYDALGYFYLQIYDYDFYAGMGTASFLVAGSLGTSKGFWALMRTGSGSFDGYHDGSTWNVTDANQAFSSVDIFLGAENFATAPFNYTTKSYTFFMTLKHGANSTVTASIRTLVVNFVTAFGGN